MDFSQFYGHRNKVIIISGETFEEIGEDKDKFANIDGYVKYHDSSNYAKYIIKERWLDSHNNLILICDEE